LGAKANQNNKLERRNLPLPTISMRGFIILSVKLSQGSTQIMPTTAKKQKKERSGTIPGR
jgi:hypothetical protein